MHKQLKKYVQEFKEGNLQNTKEQNVKNKKKTQHTCAL